MVIEAPSIKMVVDLSIARSLIIVIFAMNSLSLRSEIVKKKGEDKQ